jgi:hypothetical protein
MDDRNWVIQVVARCHPQRQRERARRLAVGEQRHREARADAERGRLPGKARPALVGGEVVDADRAGMPHGVQAGAVAHPVLDVVRLAGELVGARDGGGRAPALPQRHAAGQPFARHTGREHRELVQELLHAVGLQQRVLQPYELRCMTLILHVVLLPVTRR